MTNRLFILPLVALFLLIEITSGESADLSSFPTSRLSEVWPFTSDSPWNLPLPVGWKGDPVAIPSPTPSTAPPLINYSGVLMRAIGDDWMIPIYVPKKDEGGAPLTLYCCHSIDQWEPGWPRYRQAVPQSVCSEQEVNFCKAQPSIDPAIQPAPFYSQCLKFKTPPNSVPELPGPENGMCPGTNSRLCWDGHLNVVDKPHHFVF